VAPGDDALEHAGGSNPSRRGLLFSAGAAAGAAAFKAIAKIGRIELGVCGNPDAFPKPKQWGFDYFEPGAASIAAMIEPEFMPFGNASWRSRLRCRSFNSLEFRTLKGSRPRSRRGANLDIVSAYLDSTLDRCRCKLGGARGGVGKREFPRGSRRLSRDLAWTRSRLSRRAGDIAKGKQMVIGIDLCANRRATS